MRAHAASVRTANLPEQGQMTQERRFVFRQGEVKSLSLRETAMIAKGLHV